MDFLAEQQIGIESCLTSNIQTSTVADLAAHPLKTFLSMAFVPALTLTIPAYREWISFTNIPLPRQLLGYPASKSARHRLMVWKWLSSAQRKNAHCEKSRCEVTKMDGANCTFPFSRKAQSRAMFGGFDAQLNQLHYLDCLTCRNRIFTIAI